MSWDARIETNNDELRDGFILVVKGIKTRVDLDAYSVPCEDSVLFARGPKHYNFVQDPRWSQVVPSGDPSGSSLDDHQRLFADMGRSVDSYLS